MIRIVRRPDVSADLEHIWLESRRRFGLEQADRLIHLIEEKFLILAEYRLLGANRPELGERVRSFPVGRYPFVIYFEPISDGVEIIAVLHGRRKPETALDRR
jgi:toxin ParE1/3/4